ncbi:MAG: peroxiredoxin [Candidatus Dependentiae bacterium]|nr:peroxiredoxin [Candidatus Dependentiae bacterium]
MQASQKLVGKPAPVFCNQAVYPDGSVKDFDLKNFIGQNIVLYFYPMDNTPGCTIQAKKFRDEIDRLKAENIMVVGISTDSVQSHKNFQKKLALPYPLIADTGKNSISKMYKTNGIFFGKRETFLINKKGIIFKVFDHVDIKNQIDDILEAFEK